MIQSIHCVRRFAPALPLRGTSLRDGLRKATDAVLNHHNQPISVVWASIRNSPILHLNNHRDLSKVQGRLTMISIKFIEKTNISLTLRSLTHAQNYSFTQPNIIFAHRVLSATWARAKKSLITYYLFRLMT